MEGPKMQMNLGSMDQFEILKQMKNFTFDLSKIGPNVTTHQQFQLKQQRLLHSMEMLEKQMRHEDAYVSQLLPVHRSRWMPRLFSAIATQYPLTYLLSWTLVGSILTSAAHTQDWLDHCEYHMRHGAGRSRHRPPRRVRSQRSNTGSLASKLPSDVDPLMLILPPFLRYRRAQLKKSGYSQVPAINPTK
jgi:hypothetical protein